MPYKDPEQQRDYQRQYLAKRRANFFMGKNCAVCFSLENLVLDHIDPKQKVSHRIWSWSQERREAEIAKCQILCVKCHQEKTWNDNYEIPEHGTYNRYSSNKFPCRCELCTGSVAPHWEAYRAGKRLS